MKRKMAVFATAIIMTLAVAVTGCGKRINETETAKTEKATEQPVTEKVTETEKQTEEKRVEILTEKLPEKSTEKETEKLVETKAPATLTDLSEEEELAREEEFSDARTYYAIDIINVRSTPSTENNDNVVDYYAAGDRVNVIGETANWYKVRDGYVYKANLSETAPEGSGSDEEGLEATGIDLEYDVVIADEPWTMQAIDVTNIRTEPTLELGDNIIGSIPEGVSCTVYGENDRWYKISYEDVIGYVGKNLLN